MRLKGKLAVCLAFLNFSTLLLTAGFKLDTLKYPTHGNRDGLSQRTFRTNHTMSQNGTVNKLTVETLGFEKQEFDILSGTLFQSNRFSNKLKAFLIDGHFDFPKFSESFDKLKTELECITRSFWKAKTHYVRHILQQKYSQELFNTMSSAKRVLDNDLNRGQLIIFEIYEAQLLGLAMYRSWSIPDTELPNFARRAYLLASRLNLITIDVQENRASVSEETAKFIQEQLQRANEIVSGLWRGL